MRPVPVAGCVLRPCVVSHPIREGHAVDIAYLYRKGALLHCDVGLHLMLPQPPHCVIHPLISPHRLPPTSYVCATFQLS